MKTILEKLATRTDPQVLVGKKKWERERWTKERGKKCPRSCLMRWGEIYRNDSPASSEIHKVINSCSALSQRKTKVRPRTVCTEVKRKEKEAKLDWCGDCFCRDCYTWQGRISTSPTLREAPADSLSRGFVLGGRPKAAGCVQVHGCCSA